jgi:hypothetical protein
MVINYGWEPGKFMELDEYRKLIFLRYMEKMYEDPKWKKILEMKNRVVM